LDTGEILPPMWKAVDISGRYRWAEQNRRINKKEDEDRNMSFRFRKTWKCGEEWVEGELTINTKNGCGQDIYQSNDRRFRSGKFMILNLRDGKGGIRDDPHVCPNKVGSKFHNPGRINMREYDYHQEHKPCVSCGHKFNSYKNPLCPNCFRLRCRKCLNLQQWIVILDESGEWHPTKCFSCGHDKLDVEAIPKDLIVKNE